MYKTPKPLNGSSELALMYSLSSPFSYSLSLSSSPSLNLSPASWTNNIQILVSYTSKIALYHWLQPNLQIMVILSTISNEISNTILCLQAKN